MCVHCASARIYWLEKRKRRRTIQYWHIYITHTHMKTRNENNLITGVRLFWKSVIFVLSQKDADWVFVVFFCVRIVSHIENAHKMSFGFTKNARNHTECADCEQRVASARRNWVLNRFDFDSNPKRVECGFLWRISRKLPLKNQLSAVSKSLKRVPFIIIFTFNQLKAITTHRS